MGKSDFTAISFYDSVSTRQNCSIHVLKSTCSWRRTFVVKMAFQNKSCVDLSEPTLNDVPNGRPRIYSFHKKYSESRRGDDFSQNHESSSSQNTNGYRISSLSSNGFYDNPYQVERIHDSLPEHSYRERFASRQDDMNCLEFSSENLAILPSGLGSATNELCEAMQSDFNNHDDTDQYDTAKYLPTNAYQLQYDPKPLVIYKPSPNQPKIYKQNIVIKYYKPPQLPEPGPIIIREIRNPQPMPAPPLIIRQRMPSPPTPPPLILRERPPATPKPIPAQVIIKRLPSLPPCPRQVIIERYPPFPPKPRDIIVERWLPYETVRKRRVIYQSASKEIVPKPPKNVIITYHVSKPVLKKSVNHLGVIQMEPEDYMRKYGNSVLDTSILLERARHVGVLSELEPTPPKDEKQSTSSALWIDPEEVYGLSNVNSFENPLNLSIDAGSSETLDCDNFHEPNEDILNASDELGLTSDEHLVEAMTDFSVQRLYQRLQQSHDLDNPVTGDFSNDSSAFIHYSCPLSSQMESMEEELAVSGPYQPHVSDSAHRKGWSQIRQQDNEISDYDGCACSINLDNKVITSNK